MISHALLLLLTTLYLARAIHVALLNEHLAKLRPPLQVRCEGDLLESVSPANRTHVRGACSALSNETDLVTQLHLIDVVFYSRPRFNLVRPATPTYQFSGSPTLTELTCTDCTIDTMTKLEIVVKANARLELVSFAWATTTCEELDPMAFVSPASPSTFRPYLKLAVYRNDVMRTLRLEGAMPCRRVELDVSYNVKLDKAHLALQLSDGNASVSIKSNPELTALVMPSCREPVHVTIFNNAKLEAVSLRHCLVGGLEIRRNAFAGALSALEIDFSEIGKPPTALRVICRVQTREPTETNRFTSLEQCKSLFHCLDSCEPFVAPPPSPPTLAPRATGNAQTDRDAVLPSAVTGGSQVNHNSPALLRALKQCRPNRATGRARRNVNDSVSAGSVATVADNRDRRVPAGGRGSRSCRLPHATRRAREQLWRTPGGQGRHRHCPEPIRPLARRARSLPRARPRTQRHRRDGVRRLQCTGRGERLARSRTEPAAATAINDRHFWRAAPTTDSKYCARTPMQSKNGKAHKTLQLDAPNMALRRQAFRRRVAVSRSRACEDSNALRIQLLKRRLNYSISFCVSCSISLTSCNVAFLCGVCRGNSCRRCAPTPCADRRCSLKVCRTCTAALRPGRVTCRHHLHCPACPTHLSLTNRVPCVSCRRQVCKACARECYECVNQPHCPDCWTLANFVSIAPLRCCSRYVCAKHVLSHSGCAVWLSVE